MYIMHKVHTSKRTQCASIRNNIPLMVCAVMITAHCQNHTNDINIQCGQNTQYLVLNLAIRILNTSLSTINGNSKFYKENLAPYSYWSGPSKTPSRTNVQLFSNDGTRASLWNITHFYQENMMVSVWYMGHFYVVTGFLSLTCVSATVVPSRPSLDCGR
jgi:hypothetical protein